MVKNIKIKIFLRIVRSMSVLSISAGIYFFCLNYVEIINSFQKQEYLLWINCSRDARSKAFNENLGEIWDSKILTIKLDEYQKKACSSKPQRWKLQRK